ncbi:MAG: DUF6624 domain-containing protein [Sphingobacteriaceae bacterium]|jgi:hypothetical protein
MKNRLNAIITHIAEFGVNKTFIIFICSLFSEVFFSQEKPQVYIELIKRAENLYSSNKFCESSEEYSKAFAFLKAGYPVDRYNAACSYALCNKPDSSFLNLFKLVDKARFSNVYQLLTESDFVNLHSDNRWSSVISKAKLNRYDELKMYNVNLIQIIDSLIIEDQKYRSLIRHYDNTHSKENSNELERNLIARKMKLTDSLNYFELVKIIEKFGYPNFDLVGEESSNNFWALVQHQDRHISFQDSVLKLLKKEVDNNKASKSNYAYLVDRLLVNKNKKQIYGTQVRLNRKGDTYEPEPVKDKKNLNKRRAEMGLTPIEEYIKKMNTKFFGTLQKKSR